MTDSSWKSPSGTTTNSPRALPFRRVGLVGLGVIGGSIAGALSALASPPEVIASSADAGELERAVADGIVQRPSTPERIASTADLVVYATSPRETLAYLEAHRDLWRAGTLLTDTSPAKREVVRRARELGLAGRFVGSHPAIPDPARGYDAARPALFAGARVWITPVEERETEPALAAEALWRAVGAGPVRLDAERHDRLVAWTAHLPALGATALAAALGASGFGPELLEADPGIALRLSDVSPAAWDEILASGGDLLDDPLMALEGALGKLMEAVRSRDPAALREVLTAAGAWRGA